MYLTYCSLPIITSISSKLSILVLKKSDHSFEDCTSDSEDEFNSLEELEKAIIEYIDYYNNKRISLKRKGLSPIEYRHQSLASL